MKLYLTVMISLMKVFLKTQSSWMSGFVKMS